MKSNKDKSNDNRTEYLRKFSKTEQQLIKERLDYHRKLNKNGGK